MEKQYHIKVNGFEGPMDLLLHLIQRLEIDIHDIPVAEITDQYMDYIHAMNDLELDVASEYLVMAATLLAIKSNMLLPNESLDLDEEEFEEDPREELIERLKEYQKYKRAAERLKEKESEDNEVYTRTSMNMENEKRTKQEATVYTMIDALSRMFKKPFPHKDTRSETGVKREEMPIQLTMDYILKEIENSPGGMLFEDFFSTHSKTEMVTTFLAMLELVKDNRVTCYQDEHFKGLYVYKREGNDE
ncbi:segregation and condensation protein A [Salimicrobium flavidum]|uniref:Segregation and condensation protein A n=1 Tax=Salimicrobium flavidum TaxID=570947 RepID=A0A1N7IJ12_9BACI|nr:segregation/condensation protein A [Salimicrobium flavidum]SIS37038.1 condensin subunit ScpA [Salimicrobium flavidum]